VWLLTEACLRARPGIHHIVNSLATMEIIRRLDEFDLDIGLTYLEDERLARFNVMPLYRERYFLLARKGSLPGCDLDHELGSRGAPAPVSSDEQHAEPADHQRRVPACTRRGQA
jgi:hypothetical protein